MSEKGRAEALARWAANYEISQLQKQLCDEWEQACDRWGEYSKQARAIRARIDAMDRERP